MKTQEAYYLKNTIELIKANIAKGSWVIKPDCATFREADQKETVLIDVILNANPIQEYHCRVDELVCGVSCEQLCIVVKRSKKKDFLDWVIATGQPDTDMDITIENEARQRSKEGRVRILDIERREWDTAEYGRYSASIPASEFAKMCKELSKNAKSITVEVFEAGIVFYAGTPERYFLKDEFGVMAEGEVPFYSGVFEEKQFSRISKISGVAQAATVKIYANENINDPLKIATPIGSIGMLSIYLSPKKRA